MSLSFDQIKTLKVGDSFYDCGYGKSINFIVTESPIIGNGVDGHATLSWKGINAEGVIIDFLITQGLEHYGPKIYGFDPYAF